jgi:hypothetical protein
LIGLVIVAVAMAFASSATAATVRSVALTRGATKVSVRVPQVNGSRPPAILMSTRPAGLRCSVDGYRYINRERSGRFQTTLRCPQARAGARARFVFRAPLIRRFGLRNGVGTVRLVVDKPRGDVRPLARLSTQPRDTDCTATRSRVRVSARRLTATARVRCHGLPRHARGQLAVGGLIAARTSAVSQTAAAAIAPAPAERTAAEISAGCEGPITVTLGGHSASWKYCYEAPFTLGPWQSHWVGHIGTTPQFGCPGGWVRHFPALEHPLAWATIGNFNVDLVTDPSSAWAWSWRLGVVSNWQFSGDVTFWWQFRCFRFSS